MTYAEKLRDPRWERRREQIILQSNFHCEECSFSSDTTKGLEVHHVCYVRGKEPWDYPDELLKCLCEECHFNRQIHDEDARFQFSRLLSQMKSWQVYELSKHLRRLADQESELEWFDAYRALMEEKP